MQQPQIDALHKFSSKEIIPLKSDLVCMQLSDRFSGNVTVILKYLYLISFRKENKKCKQGEFFEVVLE